MPLKALYKSKDEIPEGVRDEYKETDSGWELQVDGELGAEALSRERRDRKKAEREAREAKDLLKKFDGVDPDDIGSMRTRLDELEQEGASSKEDFERLRSRDKERHSKALEAVEAERDAAFGKVESLMREDAAIKALTKDGVGGIVDAMLGHVTKRIAVERNGTEFEVSVTGLDGKDTDIGGLVASMKESGEYDWGFLADSQPSGGGAGGGGAGGSVGDGTLNLDQVKHRDDLPDARAASQYIAKFGRDKFDQLPRGKRE